MPVQLARALRKNDGSRDIDEWAPARAARLQQANLIAGVFRQARGQHASRRAATDYNEIKPLAPFIHFYISIAAG